jgi:GT2 family glycosyltransferase
MDLSIIILNFNGRRWLERLLPTLNDYYLKQTRYQVEVVVVDNASTDDSIAYLNTLDAVRLIRSKKNGGFAYGNNLAIKGNPARFILLLNSDTELVPDLSNLDILLEYMDANPVVGILTPLVLLDNGKLDTACHRGEPTPWAAFTYFSGLERLFGKSSLFGKYHLTHLPQNTVHDIDACTGAAMMVRNAALDRIGLLDERFFMYAEDVDWCKRFRESGYRVVFHPGVTLLHHKYQSGLKSADQETRSTTKHWIFSTMLDYYDKHYKDQYPGFFRVLLKMFIAFKANNR